MKKLLMTHESIFTSSELLSILRLKYNTPPPKIDISEDEFKIFYSKQLSVVRLM